MADIQKPSGVNNIWAENGLKAAADPSKIDLGWVVEKPPYQVQNWLDNKQDKFQAHVNQHGIPYKDNETEYQANKSYAVDPISGIVYKCVVTHVNQPVSNPAYWDIAFSPYEAMVPTGSTQMFAGLTAPRGWLIADGSQVSRSQYSTLFSVIGTLYGAGNGSTTFNLPDMRGVAVRGVDRGRNLDPSRAQGSYQGDLFASHSHTAVATVSDSGAHIHSVSGTASSSGEHSHTGYVITGATTNNNSRTTATEEPITAPNQAITPTPLSGAHIHSVSGTASSAGTHTHSTTISVSGSGGTETRMKNIALLGIIKY